MNAIVFAPQQGDLAYRQATTTAQGQAVDPVPHGWPLQSALAIALTMAPAPS